MNWKNVNFINQSIEFQYKSTVYFYHSYRFEHFLPKYLHFIKILHVLIVIQKKWCVLTFLCHSIKICYLISGINAIVSSFDRNFRMFWCNEFLQNNLEKLSVELWMCYSFFVSGAHCHQFDINSTWQLRCSRYY